MTSCPTGRSLVLGLVLILGLGSTKIQAQETSSVSTDSKPKPAEGPALDLPPLPPEAHLRQTLTFGSRTLSYTVTVGAMPVRDEKGKKVAEVVCTSYTLEGATGFQRPVAFAMNGGPGSSSVWLNLGALGPKRIQFGAQEDNPSDPVRLLDNPGTWLEFTDLIFIDPVGTGYSRTLVNEEETKKRFWNVKGDITCLARIIYDWLHLHDRMASPKYLVGESYGGFRVPRLAATLEMDLGVGISGLVMVSPYLDGQAWHEANLSPMPWVGKLPSLAAAHLEKEGKLSAEAMAPVETYARTEFILDLLKGWTDPQALERMVQRVSEFTGLDREFVRRQGGRVNDLAYLRERFRSERRIASWYDANRTMPDPFPWAPADPENGLDPSAKDTVPTSAMVDFLGRILGWKPQARYYGSNEEIPKKWENGLGSWWFTTESGSDLRKVLSLDPKLRVLIAHGYSDLACPYFNSKILLSQIPPMGAPERLLLKVYAGGHMFYARPESLTAFQQDARALFSAK